MKQLPTVQDLTGWRLMGIADRWLTSPMQNAMLLTRRSERAVCTRGGHHKAPHQNCCGWYAMYRRERVIVGTNEALVEVKAEGETILCRDGFQAEYIIVQSIWLVKDCPQARALSTTYGVPVYEREEKPCELESPSSVLGPLQQMLQNQSPPPGFYPQPGNPFPTLPLPRPVPHPGNTIPPPPFAPLFVQLGGPSKDYLCVICGECLPTGHLLRLHERWLHHLD